MHARRSGASAARQILLLHLRLTATGGSGPGHTLTPQHNVMARTPRVARGGLTALWWGTATRAFWKRIYVDSSVATFNIGSL